MPRIKFQHVYPPYPLVLYQIAAFNSSQSCEQHLNLLLGIDDIFPHMDFTIDETFEVMNFTINSTLDELEQLLNNMAASR